MKDWKELAAQLRVDSIRCTTAAGSGHPTSCMSAADLMAVLLAKYLRFDWANPRYANNDRLIFSKGHACPLLYSMYKAAGAITDAELLTPAQVRQPARGPSQPARPALRRRRDRLARPGAAHRRRHGPQRQVSRQAALSHLGPARRQRDGRRLDLGGVRQGVVLQARQPDRHPRHEPPRPARRDRPRLEQRRLRRPRPRLRLARHRARRPRPRRPSTAPTPRRSRQKDQPTCLVAKTEKGHGVVVRGEQGAAGTARSSDAEQAKDAIAELGGERSLTVPTAKPEALAAGRSRRRDAPETADLRGRQQGGDAQGLRRRAGRARRRPAGRGRPRRRGVQLDVRRRVQEGLPGPLLRDVHRRAAAGVRRRRLRRPGQEGRSPRRSPPSSRGPTTRSAWRRSRTPPSTWPARTAGSASARTARRRWPSKTWR